MEKKVNVDRQIELRHLWYKYFAGEEFPSVDRLPSWLVDEIHPLYSWEGLANMGTTCAVPATLGTEHSCWGGGGASQALGMAFWAAVTNGNRKTAEYIFDGLADLAREREDRSK